MTTRNNDIKREAHELIDALPVEAGWEQIAYEMELRASLARGQADATAGRLHTLEEVRQYFAMPE